MHCKHCFYGFPKPLAQLLTLEDWKKVIDEFLKLGVTHFHVSGREPLISDTTFGILSYLSNQSNVFELDYGVITNGFSLDRIMHKLIQCNLKYLDFSIDGDEKENDFLRGKGVFKKVTSNLEHALINNVANRIYISSVAHKNNCNSIVRLIEMLSNHLEIKDFFIQPLQIHGRAKNLASLELSAEEYIELCDLVIKALESTRIRSGTRIVMFIPPYYLPKMLMGKEIVCQSLEQYFRNYITELEIAKSKLAFRFHITCLAFWRTVQITPDGYYLGCCMPLSSRQYWEYAIGNVKTESVSTLYEKSLRKSSPLVYSYDDRLNIECKDKPCFSKCFGGCRIFTRISTNSWSKSHPSCQE